MIDPVVLAGLENIIVQEDNMDVSLDMAELFLADQAPRQLGIGAEPEKVNKEDSLRRVKVLEYIKSGQLHSPQSLIYAAYIFQHGDCPEHYLLANRLAQAAMDAGHSDAPWIYAASLDRYLMSLGKTQKYGTQYTWINGAYKLYPVDPSTTDAEREKYNIPSLSEAMKQTPSSTGGGAVKQRWLETWWLTLIGAGYAALSAFISIVDAKKNVFHRWITLAVAILVILISIWGHYTQIIALHQGTGDIQKNIWTVANIVMIVLWLALFIFEIFRLARKKYSSFS